MNKNATTLKNEIKKGWKNNTLITKTEYEIM